MHSLDSVVARHECRERLESGVELELRPLKISNVLRSLQACTLPDQGVSVVLEVDETVHVAADELLLTWAIAELLQNALTFSRSGSQVLLRCRAEELGVTIEVEDECGGLPGDHASYLFDRADGADGLRTVRRAVEAMGGEVYVENCPGQGCVFVLFFPPAKPTRPSSIPPSSQVMRRKA
jgi:two-component system, OmpR family, heavy metal sensor histidine kinase CusS